VQSSSFDFLYGCHRQVPEALCFRAWVHTCLSESVRQSVHLPLIHYITWMKGYFNETGHINHYYIHMTPMTLIRSPFKGQGQPVMTEKFVNAMAPEPMSGDFNQTLDNYFLCSGHELIIFWRSWVKVKVIENIFKDQFLDWFVRIIGGSVILAKIKPKGQWPKPNMPQRGGGIHDGSPFSFL